MPNASVGCVEIEQYLINIYYDWTLTVWSRVIFAIFYTLTFTVGFTGSIIVLIIICYFKSLHQARNIFLANLAIADGLMLIFCLPISAYRILLHFIYYHNSDHRRSSKFLNTS